MRLHKIQGHSYYFQGPTNVGIVKYKNSMALLIDAGLDSTSSRLLAQAVEEEGLKPKYVVITHAHPDHYGAVKWLKEQYTGLLRYSHPGEAVWMANPRIESESFYGARPLRELENRFLKGPAIEMDFLIEKGKLELGEKNYEILALPGHTYNQIGVLTSDSVLFVGDSLFSEEIMEKYSFPFLLDIELQLQTIEKLAQVKADYVVLSHAQKVYTSITDLCAKNKARIDEYIEEILEWCYQPCTREDITEKVLTKNQTEADIPHYYRTHATVGAFLSYLSNRNQLEKAVISGKCYFYRE
ncbi:MAG: MBL fold metallo-hydrolase [Desulfitobacterium hafniense]|nr:MBL fold metallo-hydrolase [Desulfitobacterium hafniense]